jgi:hypothetical protein
MPNLLRCLALAAGVLPWIAAAQVTLSPSQPYSLETVRIHVPRTGTFIYDLDYTQVSMADNVITVSVRYSAALSPPPPPSTLDVSLGQLPEGAYQVRVIRDDAGQQVNIGTAAFTVVARPLSAPFADFTDLWWNSGESGWGLNIVQHESGNLFATWFVYGPNQQPLWYVIAGGTWTGSSEFHGDLYRTTGPVLTAFGFDPRAVTRTRVGDAVLRFSSANAGTLVAVIDGRTVTRNIARQPY